MNNRSDSTLDKNAHIGIIGAGPAGLAAAEALREQGYKQITILEKSGRAGGMALSLTYSAAADKKVVYELGSMQPLSSGVLKKLIKRYDLHLGKPNTSHAVMYAKIYSLIQHQPLINFSQHKLGYPLSYLWPLLRDGSKFLALLYKYRKLAKPGFTNLSEKYLAELSIPYPLWVDQQKFKLIGELLKFIQVVATFSNPEFKDQVPALGVLKLFYQLIRFPQRYINGSFKFIKEGYQELWNRVAKQHQVIFNAVITGVIRNEGKVTVKLVDDRTLIFDKLIITCSPLQAKKFLDVTEEEKYIFDRVLYFPGWRVAFLARNLPHDSFYSFYEPYMNKGYGPCLQTFYPEGQVDKDTWLYSSMFSLNKNEPLEPLLAQAEKLLQEEFHGKDIQWLNRMYWPEYTPCFNCEDTKNGIYDKFEALQGKNNTYYMGGTISGSSHATVIEYAYDIVKKLF
jgi:hypothetical protein